MNGEEILRFAQSNPWSPAYPPAILRRFLTEFVSSEKLIFEVSDHRGRQAVAVLLDRVSNLANDACLEIIAARADVDPAKVFFHFVNTARQHIPPDKAGLQVGINDRIKLNEEALQKAGLVSYYDTYKMLRPSLKNVPGVSPAEISAATQADANSVYEVLCRSFALNPETSIPDEKSWKSAFLSSPESHIFLWKRNQEVLGFAAVVGDRDFNELLINTIGVLPKARKLGIGENLLMHCLRQGEAEGYATAQLTVAAANAQALGLYVRCGFSSVERFRCFRLPKG